MIWGVNQESKAVGWQKWARSLLRRPVLVGLSPWMGEKPLQKSLLMAPRDLLGVAKLLLGFCASMLFVMDAGHMTDNYFGIWVKKTPVVLSAVGLNQCHVWY